MRIVAAAALLAVVPLLLATWAFGRAYEQSEIGRADARLVAGAEMTLSDSRAAADDAAALVDGTARSTEVQAALAAGTPTPARRVATAHGVISLTVEPGRTPAPARGIVRTAIVKRGTRVLGTVTGVVGLHSVALRTGLHTAVRTAHGDGRSRPHDGTLAGERFRLLTVRAGNGEAVELAIPYSTISRSVRHRELLTLGAGASTIAALAALVLLMPNGLRPRRTRRHPERVRPHRRSPVALVGDIAVAAHDPHALLPVLLETAVVATDAAGGRVIWNGEELAAIGERAGTEVVLSLDDEDGAARLVLYPAADGLTTRDAEILESLVAQGKVALENARLHGIVRRQAQTDELTDLANRRRFMEALQHEVARARRFGTHVSLVLFDLDRFKAINDECGHQVGDRVLQDTASVIRERVRETDLPARIGGEEFAVILAGTDANGAVSFAHQLRRDLEQRVRVDRSARHVTASFGVATAQPASTAETLIAAADRALYRAKAAGRNAVRLAAGAT